MFSMLTNFHASGLQRTGNLVGPHRAPDGHGLGSGVNLNSAEGPKIQVNAALQLAQGRRVAVTAASSEKGNVVQQRILDL